MIINAAIQVCANAVRDADRTRDAVANLVTAAALNVPVCLARSVVLR